MLQNWAVGICVLCCGALAVTAADSKTPKPEKHVERNIEGWTVHVDSRLLEGDAAPLGREALDLLDRRLADIKLALPQDKIERLQKVPIWLDRTHGALTAAQYHPSAGWLKANGYDEALTRCVHIPDAADFVSRRHQLVQPWSVLHELAHAYHDQVLDFDHPEILAAWQRFKDSGRYEQTLHSRGHKTKHYALTNQKEFFAEMTESYFGVNDFFPFNRAELKQEEPELCKLLGEIWESKPAEKEGE
jgi:hypothetical protein